MGIKGGISANKRVYLTVSDSFLVRNFSLHRYSQDVHPKNEINIKGEFENINIFIDNVNFSHSRIGNVKTQAILTGKKLITPYSKPYRCIKSKRDLLGDDKKHEAFIIDIDEAGAEIIASCNQSHGKDSYFLKSVFFKKSVLKQYYDSDNYIIHNSHLSRASLWGIDFCETKEGLIQAYLGDLGHLPYKEQLHWKQFNIYPKGHMTEDRFRRDFLAEFAEPDYNDNPIYHLKKAYDSIKSISLSKFGVSVFRELHKDDKYLYENLRIPISDDFAEFDNQLITLSKVFCDALNVNGISNITGKKIDKKDPKSKIKGALNLFEDLIISQSDDKTAETIMNPFYNIYHLRSSSSGHTKGKEYETNLKRYGIDGLPNSQKIKKMITDLYNSLERIRKLFR